MARRMPRLNRVIELFERGEVVFGGVIFNGDIESAIWMAESNYDFCFIEMEHSGFDFPTLHNTLQFMLNRKQIAEKGNLQPQVVPFTRIPANCREYNQWVIKQSLDYGVYGLVVPHLNTVKEAIALVQAARYHQLKGVPDFEPVGLRGAAPTNAMRYWGLTYREYYDAADVWPLDPDGEILLMPLIEEEEGVNNIRDILKEVKGIGAIFTGEVDLSISLGHPLEIEHPVVQEALRTVLAACKEFNVPCGCLANPQNIEERLRQGYRFTVTGPSRVPETMQIGRRVVASMQR